MFSLNEIKKTGLIALWFVFLTFPIMVIKVDSIEQTVLWRWENALYVGLGTFILRFLILFMKSRKEKAQAAKALNSNNGNEQSFIHRIIAHPAQRKILFGALLASAVIYPLIFDTYQINIMITALIYTILFLVWVLISLWGWQVFLILVLWLFML